MTSHHDTPSDAPTDATETPNAESNDVRKDTAYSPGSETETQRKQDERVADDVEGEVEAGQVRVAPGTGGPDDVGDVDVDPEDLNLSGH